MYNSIEKLNNNKYRCLRCNKLFKEVDINAHIWRYHREEEISACMNRLDSYIDRVSSFFVSSRNMNVDHKDLAQYMRIKLVELLRSNKFHPPNVVTIDGDSIIDRFVKAACNIIPLNYMTYYFQKNNHVHYRPEQVIDINKFPDYYYDIVVEDKYATIYSEEDNHRRDQGGIIDKNDHYSEVEESLYNQQVISIIKSKLCGKDLLIFTCLVENEDITQKEIGKKIGITQPTVQWRIKNLRKKIKKILKDINYL